METDEIIERKKRNFVIITISLALGLAILKGYSDYRINKLNKNLRLRR